MAKGSIKKEKSENSFTLKITGLTTGKLMTLSNALRGHINTQKSEVATDLLFILRNAAIDSPELDADTKKWILDNTRGL